MSSKARHKARHIVQGGCVFGVECSVLNIAVLYIMEWMLVKHMRFGSRCDVRAHDE